MVGYRALDVPEYVHRGMPSSMLTFIVSLDDGVEAADTVDALPAARPNPLILGGLHMHATHVRQRPGQAGVQLAVHPLAARALFGVPAAELTASGFDGTAILDRGIDLRDRVAEAREWREVFELVAGYLTDARQRREEAAVRPEVAYAWHLMQRTKGRIPVGDVADRIGISARHLTTLFRREVGRSPKAVTTLMRFEHATARIAESVRRSGRADLATVAANTGYCDQAHLTNEFVRFVGAPPRRWLAEEFRNIQDGGHSGWSEFGHDNNESDRLVDAASP
jgi:AraC-like DNA-binding protein